MPSQHSRIRSEAQPICSSATSYGVLPAAVIGGSNGVQPRRCRATKHARHCARSSCCRSGGASTNRSVQGLPRNPLHRDIRSPERGVVKFKEEHTENRISARVQVLHRLEPRCLFARVLPGVDSQHGVQVSIFVHNAKRIHLVFPARMNLPEIRSGNVLSVGRSLSARRLQSTSYFLKRNFHR